MTDRVTKALAALKSEGGFAAELACGSGDLHIEVEGAGPIRFPISATTARKLCAVARPAQFGRRDKTLYDRGVRDTWEIDKSRVEIDAAAWKRTLDPQLSLLRDQLGLARTAKLKAVFDKMLVYAPGQFFAPHQDSERAKDMIGTLVVELPSPHTGGAVIVQHRDQKQVFHGAARGPTDLSLLAFYADTRHEVEPIQSGYRVALTYRLHHRWGPSHEAPSDLSALVDRLAESVDAYFSTPVAPRYASTPPARPDRLIYLLDHEYTQQSLGWDHLKNADRLRASALRQVADRLDCEAYLALADVHESWSCEDEGYGYGRRRYGRDYHEDEDEGGDTGAEEYDLIELLGSDVELRHWVGSDGKAKPAVAMPALDNEICCTLPSVELDPFKSEHEGYMGNYGNTVDRWYHRAAVVMWPRSRNFVVRAKVSPSWAVNELRKRILAGDLLDARAKAKSLLPFWSQSASKEGGAAFFAKLCAVADELDDRDLAHTLLAPFGPDRLAESAMPAFASLVERFGLTWSQRLFSTWSDERRYSAPPWRTSLPRICKALSSSGGDHGKALAHWLLEREATSFQKGSQGALHLPMRWSPDPPSEWQHGLLALFDAARVLGASSTRDSLLAFLTAPKSPLPPLAAGALLQEARDGRAPAEVRALGLHALHRHVVTSLEQALARPVRSLDDWSIEPPQGCNCELCKELSAFLRAPDRIEHAWPLATEGRRHIHNHIDYHQLPVAHTTTRSGRPYTLVLQKQNALFERDLVLRERQKAMLSWLKKQKASFAEGG